MKKRIIAFIISTVIKHRLVSKFVIWALRKISEASDNQLKKENVDEIEILMGLKK